MQSQLHVPAASQYFAPHAAPAAALALLHEPAEHVPIMQSLVLESHCPLLTQLHVHPPFPLQYFNGDVLQILPPPDALLCEAHAELSHELYVHGLVLGAHAPQLAVREIPQISFAVTTPHCLMSREQKTELVSAVHPGVV